MSYYVYGCFFFEDIILNVDLFFCFLLVMIIEYYYFLFYFCLKELFEFKLIFIIIIFGVFVRFIECVVSIEID